MTRTVRVALGERSYSILIGRNLLARLGSECRKLQLGSRCAVISDRSVARLYAAPLLKNLRAAGFDPSLVVIPAGEKSKNMRQVEACSDQLARAGLERKSFVVALGGGVVGDLAGFVAATYLRGIRFVQVPTTLLAQVDSSVGGKVGVNLDAGKNLVGAFHQPELVLCDLQTLRTLPEREYRAGLAEVIKYGIICDRDFFDQLERHFPRVRAREPKFLATVIERCCRIKAEVVAGDEKETGRRAILNFGHTIGHAIEAVSRYGKYLHGEAISIGQVAAANLSVQHAGMKAADADRIRALFIRTGLPTEIRLNTSQRRKLIEAMRRDKKVAQGRIRFVLAPRIGRAIWNQQIDGRGLGLALDRLRQSRKT